MAPGLVNTGKRTRRGRGPAKWRCTTSWRRRQRKQSARATGWSIGVAGTSSAVAAAAQSASTVCQSSASRSSRAGCIPSAGRGATSGTASVVAAAVAGGGITWRASLRAARCPRASSRLCAANAWAALQSSAAGEGAGGRSVRRGAPPRSLDGKYRAVDTEAPASRKCPGRKKPCAWGHKRSAPRTGIVTDQPLGYHERTCTWHEACA